MKGKGTGDQTAAATRRKEQAGEEIACPTNYAAGRIGGL